jgi:hypothetical protein
MHPEPVASHEAAYGLLFVAFGAAEQHALKASRWPRSEVSKGRPMTVEGMSSRRGLRAQSENESSFF